jgi:hypothetical protein
VQIVRELVVNVVAGVVCSPKEVDILLSEMCTHSLPMDLSNTEGEARPVNSFAADNPG